MFLTTVIFCMFAIVAIQGLTVIPESVRVLEQNSQYIKWVNTNIRRYQRKGDYVINFSLCTMQTWGNNITLHIVLTEYLHNEYRPSFIQLSYRLCDFINKEPYIGGMIKKTGVNCPGPAGEYHLPNMTIQSHDFQYVFPFTKGGANVNLKLTETGETIARFEYHVKFMQKKL